MARAAESVLDGASISIEESSLLRLRLLWCSRRSSSVDFTGMEELGFGSMVSLPTAVTIRLEL